MKEKRPGNDGGDAEENDSFDEVTRNGLANCLNP